MTPAKRLWTLPYENIGTYEDTKTSVQVGDSPVPAGRFHGWRC